MQKLSQAPLPGWVPPEIRRYLMHTEAGQPIRRLARKAGCHPSTVLRQVRRVESQRDDPLVDEVLRYLAGQLPQERQEPDRRPAGDRKSPVPSPWMASGFEREAASLLTLLSRGGAVLAAAEGMDMAVVVREGAEADRQKVAVSRPLAGALALCGWINCARQGRISRYAITAAGRTALGRIVADQDSRARSQLAGGFAEAQTPFHAPEVVPASPPTVPACTSSGRRARYTTSETPLEMLARLADKDGQPYLTPGMVRAGRRLREDFELAQISGHLVQEALYFNGGSKGNSNPMRSSSQQAGAEARNRMSEALQSLGMGLSDIALRCCCHLEGLETAERNLGWPARSGKVVLRIALQHLADFYGEASAATAEMIG